MRWLPEVAASDVCPDGWEWLGYDAPQAPDVRIVYSDTKPRSGDYFVVQHVSRTSALGTTQRVLEWRWYDLEFWMPFSVNHYGLRKALLDRPEATPVYGWVELPL